MFFIPKKQGFSLGIFQKKSYLYTIIYLLTKNFRIMASRKSLKKTVNYITEVAAGLCLVESANATAEKREAYSQLFLQIINLRNDIISRISHTEPGSVKLFYKKLRTDFNAEVDNVFKKLEELAK